MAWIRNHLLFVICVAIPTLCAAVYFGLIATDVYVSESHFVVTGAESSMPSGGLAALLMGGGSHSHERIPMKSATTSCPRDFYSGELGGKFKLDQIFGNSGFSYIDRYPGLIYDRSFEELFKYYIRHVEIEMDSSSSIVTLSVRAFSAEDAQKINAELLDMSERLINKLNERSRQDLVKFADGEVKVASDKAKEAAMALFTYRSHQSVFEPNKQASLQLETVGKINQELLSTEAQIAEIKKLSPDNPQIGGLESSADMLRKTITAETGKVHGFQRLALVRGRLNVLTAPSWMWSLPTSSCHLRLKSWKARAPMRRKSRSIWSA